MLYLERDAIRGWLVFAMRSAPFGISQGVLFMV